MPIFQPILIILVSKFMVLRALSDLLLGLLSPLSYSMIVLHCKVEQILQNMELIFIWNVSITKTSNFQVGIH